MRRHRFHPLLPASAMQESQRTDPPPTARSYRTRAADDTGLHGFALLWHRGPALRTASSGSALGERRRPRNVIGQMARMF